MILIRHAESTWNQARRVQGHMNPGLSDRGRAQAALLASRLRGRPFAGLYTSPLRRALETASVLGESVGFHAQPVDGLQEIRLGAWEGKTAEEIRAIYGNAYDRWHDSPLEAPGPPGGEEIRAFQQRAIAALEDLRKEHPDGNVLVVTHGGVIKVYLCSILGLDLNRMFWLKTDNTAVTEILFNRETANVALLNDTCHLNGHNVAEPILDAPLEGDRGRSPSAL